MPHAATTQAEKPRSISAGLMAANASKSTVIGLLAPTLVSMIALPKLNEASYKRRRSSIAYGPSQVRSPPQGLPRWSTSCRLHSSFSQLQLSTGADRVDAETEDRLPLCRPSCCIERVSAVVDAGADANRSARPTPVSRTSVISRSTTHFRSAHV